MKRALLLSSIHPATDPRIVYKTAPALASCFEVICALPEDSHTVKNTSSDIKMIWLPRYEGLLQRILFCHPVILWKCLRFRPEYVHIFVPELIPVAILFKWLGAKIIYEVQENLYKKFEIKTYNNHPVFRLFFKRLDGYARKQFHCIFTDDSYLSEYQNLKHPSVVIRNFVSLTFVDQYVAQNIKWQINRRSFFYCGVISMERCFDTLVAAIASMTHQYPDLTVHLFGPVRFQEKDAEQLPDYHRVKKHLIFYGYTDLKKALPYAKHCIAGIALLKPVADYPDSYTTKIFEYMALNLPVITSDFPLYKDVVQKSDCGFCIPPDNASLLSKAMEWIISTPDKARIMGNNGRLAAEKHYNWEKEQHYLLKFYSQISK
ncbi:group 1 glycosyl transferase [Dyadobacter luteus]|uniref:Group 1 glycosyl transferase n=1 Tax=Dyadobacter luteus TaxID=2259619 RepID=A0A3D8Y882_9BACT|nr:glycosyltransferase [Dyadobacter luteus]REA59291.1 group 1 glycosyl transferase [Dyadobacter luteus]